MSFLNHLEWRFATKSFDAEKKINDEQLQQLKDAIRFAPSSFGLQAFHVDIISNQELKEELKTVSWNQPQITDCSHLIVFSARTDINERIENFLDIMADHDEEKKKGLQDYANMMRGFAEHRSDEWIQNWAGKQAYIALGFAMAACAELEIDSCPLEGLDPEKYDQIIGHPEHLKTCVALAVGFRKEGPAYDKKRFPEADMFSEKN